ncbi:MAG: glycosyltransferase family 39 protein [Chloroflexi bacterium]|nr:glycosyltransferase family 39 protein [Chloroflexota bacterium]MCI0731589.1 glycosyltransferase family 39 protein [Chloroflexota bacterium]
MNKSDHRPGQRLLFLLILVTIILLAAFLRVHNLDGLPPALYHDEAVNGLDAHRLLETGRPAVFYPRNGGREPLHIYFQALALLLLGHRAWSLRVLSALVGTLTVPLLYRLARELFRSQGQRAGLIGLLAAAVLALTFWHVHFSRLTFRALYLLPLAITALWLFWRGWQRRRFRLFLGSGLALGLSLYTYLPARLLPLMLASFILAQLTAGWWRNGRQWRPLLQTPLLKGSLVTAVLSLLVMAPLGLYFLTHPTAFAQRSGDVSILNTAAATGQPALALLGQNVLRVARMFVDEGDLNLRHNLPGRPALDPLAALGFWAGLLVALRRLRQPPFLLLCLWLLFMLLPTLLAFEAPHFLRAIGALPPVAILVAVGLAWLGEKLFPPGRVNDSLRLAGILAVVTLVIGTLTTTDYFQRWAHAPALADKFDLPEYTLAQRVLALSEREDVAVPLRLYSDPPFLFYLEPTFQQVAPVESWPAGRPVSLVYEHLDTAQTLVLFHRRPPTSGVIYVPPPLDFQTMAALSAAATISAQRVLDESGQPVGWEMANAAMAMPRLSTASHALEENFAGEIGLVGYTLSPEYVQPGQPVQLVLYWQRRADINADYRVFIHLVTAAYDKIAQQDAEPLAGVFPTSLWPAGEVIADPYTFVVPGDAVPGKYRFDVGLYRPVTGRRLPLLNGAGKAVGDHLLLGAITVGTVLPAATPAVTSNATFGEPPLIRLLGYDLQTAQAKRGGALTLDLYWQALATVPVDYTVFVHLLDESGAIVSQRDVMPADGRFPTSLWFAGETVRDPHQLQLPAGLPAGTYRLLVGLYRPASGERLVAQDSQGNEFPDRALLLAPVDIAP